MIAGFTIAAAMAVAGPQAAVPAPIAAGEAVALWKRLCVDSLPTPQNFVDALNADLRNGGGWTAFDRRQRDNLTEGRSWRSARGALTYVYVPSLPLTLNTPACHFSFAVETGYTHDQGVSAVRTALGLDAGTSTGNAKAPQQRWEVDRPDGTHVRIFLSRASDFGVPGARLSVSLRRQK